MVTAAGEVDMEPLRVLELFSGIGAFHYALKRTKIKFQIVAAYEIHPLLLETYQYNFGRESAFNRNIESLSIDELNLLRIDLIAMSPPCQPFCRTGLKQDTEDSRTKAFLHLIDVLAHVNFKYLLLENVEGFEKSDTRQLLIDLLKTKNFTYQEFLLNPKDICIPNSRPRYYIMAKKEDIKWIFKPSDQLVKEIPKSSSYHHIVKDEEDKWKEYRNKSSHLSSPLETLKWCIGDCLQSDDEIHNKTDLCIQDQQFDKYSASMDIVTCTSTSSNCFTKNYGRFIKGTGSILDESQSSSHSNDEKYKDKVEEKSIDNCNLRYFTRLMTFPEDFEFPLSMNLLQQYKALGNSINVYIVSILFQLLLSTDDDTDSDEKKKRELF